MVRESRHRLVGSFLLGSRRSARPSLEPLEVRIAPAVFTVTSTLDDGSAGTLRNAIAQSNSTEGVANSIVIATTGTIHLSSELQITNPVSIIGPGASTPGATIAIQRDANASQFRLLEIDDVDVSLSNLEFTGGSLDGDGGGIFDVGGALTVSNCDILDNAATGEGPQGGGIYATGTLTVVDSTIEANHTDYLGGGIYASGALTVTDSTIEENSAYIGGGIYSDTAPSLTITDSLIGENTAQFLGGGVFVTSTTNEVQISNTLFVDDSATYDGGGLYLQEVNANVSGTTFQGNRAEIGGGAYVEADEVNQFAEFVNSTFGGNQATQDEGGAVATLASYANLEVDFFDCTLADNTAAGSAGVGGAFAYQGPGGPTQFVYQGSLFAYNSDASLGGAGTQGVDYDLISLGNNLSTDGAGMSEGDIITPDADLGALGYYGGLTPTIPLEPGSPAIDAGTTIDGITTDQRGVSRPQGTAPDIGAFEVQPQQFVLATNDEFVNVGTTFSRSGSVTGDGNAQVYVNYGDSQRGSVGLPVEYGPGGTFALSHAYAAEGTYDVTVTLVDSTGIRDTRTFQINVLLDGVPTDETDEATTTGPGAVTCTATAPGGAFTVVATLVHSGLTNASLIVAIVPTFVASGLNGSSQIGADTITSAYDVRAIGVGPDDVVTIVFHYYNNDFDLPILRYYNSATDRQEAVDTDLYVVDPVAMTITLVLDKNSDPRIQDISGTVFTIAVPLAVSVPPLASPSALSVGLTPNTITVSSLAGANNGGEGIELASNSEGSLGGSSSSALVTGSRISFAFASFITLGQPLADEVFDGSFSAADRANLLRDLPTVPDSLITLPGPILTPGSAEAPVPREPAKASSPPPQIPTPMSRLDAPIGDAVDALDEVFARYDDAVGESLTDWHRMALVAVAVLAGRPAVPRLRRSATDER